MNVFVIGTCRIHHPLEASTDNSKIKIINDSNQSFLHTTPEIIHRLEYLKGDYFYGQKLQNFQLTNNSADLLKNYCYSDVDIFLIEISSRKLISYEKNYLQWNNTIKTVKKLGSEFSSLWLKSLNKKFKQGGKVLNFEIESLPNVLNMDEFDIISSIKARKQENIELEMDIEKIIKLTNRKVIFVSHINVLNKDSNLIKPRNELINSIEEICKRKNYYFIDPSELLFYVNQKELMDKEGESVNHYNPEKLNFIGSFLHDKILRMKDIIAK